jgi:mRNA interferase RelE/StbE
MSYSVVIPKRVQKQFDKLPDQVYQRILKKLRLLENEPRPSGAIKLKGMDDEYRLHVGNYRLRCMVDDDKQVVILSRCQHRKNVYE